ATVHLHRATRDPHPGSREDGALARPGAAAGTRRVVLGAAGAVRGDEEAGPGGSATGSRALRDAVREHAMAGRDAVQLDDDREADRVLQGTRRARDAGRRRADDEERAPVDAE